MIIQVKYTKCFFLFIITYHPDLVKFIQITISSYSRFAFQVTEINIDHTFQGNVPLKLVMETSKLVTRM